jgi:hypothetical protein
MDKINISLFENDKQLIDLINYSFKIITINYNENTTQSNEIEDYLNSNINLKFVNYDLFENEQNTILNFCENIDCFIWKIKYNIFKRFEFYHSYDLFSMDDIDKNKNELNVMLKLIDNTILNKIIIILDIDEFNFDICLYENEEIKRNFQFLKNILNVHNKNIEFTFSFVNIKKSIGYMSIMFDDFEKINPDTINLVLIEELGKQNFKKLDTIEKKKKQINILKEKEESVDEWMNLSGIDNFIDLIEINLINHYDKIINSHAKNQIVKLNKNIKNINNNNHLINYNDILLYIQSANSIKNILAKSLDNSNNNLDIIKVIHNEDTTDLINSVNSVNSNAESSKYYDEFTLISDINELIINNLNLPEPFEESKLDECLNLLEQYEILYQEHLDKNSAYEKIKDKHNQFIKIKLLMTFDEELFNKLLLSNTIDTNFFIECISCCLNSNPNNFTKLLSFSEKNSSLYTNVIINEFIKIDVKKCTIDKDSLIKGLKIILPTNKYNISNYDSINNIDTKLISQIIFKIVKIKFSETPNLIEQTKYIFEKTIQLIDMVLIKNKIIHNIYYNYNVLVNNNVDLTEKKEPNDKLINFETFVSTIEYFEKILDILLNSVGYFIEKKNTSNNSNKNILIELDNNSNNDSDSDSDSETNAKSYSDNNEKSGSEQDSNFDLESGSDSDSDFNSIKKKINKTKQIEKIYEFIKNTMNGKHLNQKTLKHISEIYFNKTGNYSQSIKQFESDIKKKIFTKFYKENNAKNK